MFDSSKIRCHTDGVQTTKNDKMSLTTRNFGKFNFSELINEPPYRSFSFQSDDKESTVFFSP